MSLTRPITSNLETIAAGQGFAADVRESFPGREKGLCRHGPGRDDLRHGRAIAQDAELHQGRHAPWGIIISPDGKFLYSANGPSNDISVIDLETEKEVQRIPAGKALGELCWCQSL
jgi:YVTN family beta-propeller protein